MRIRMTHLLCAGAIVFSILLERLTLGGAATGAAAGRQLLRLQTGARLEKLMYALILITGMVFLASSGGWSYRQHRLYLLIINVLIGAKVFSGLSMIYLHFMAGETEDEA